MIATIYLIYNYSLSSPLAFYKNVEGLLETQEYDKAKNLCLKRIDTQPNDFVLKYYLGEALEGLKDYPGAIIYYEKAAIGASASDNDPVKIQLYMKTGQLYKKMHKDKEAIGYYAMVLEREPNNSKALYAIGEIYFESKSYDKSREYLQTYVIQKPEHVKTRFMLGSIYFKSKKYPEALEHFEFLRNNSVVLDDVIRPKVLSDMADCYTEVKNYQKALEVLEELIAEKLYYEDAVLKTVQVKIRSSEIDSVVAFIKEHIDGMSQSNKGILMFMLGNAYYKTNKYVDAIKSWKSAHELNSNQKNLREIIDEYAMIIGNPRLEGLYTDDTEKGERFLQKLLKAETIKKTIKKTEYWACQGGKFVYILYRIPQIVPFGDILDMINTVKVNFNFANSFTLFSLYGIDQENANNANVKDIIVVAGQEFVNLVNTNLD